MAGCALVPKEISEIEWRVEDPDDASGYPNFMPVSKMLDQVQAEGSSQ